MAVNNTKIFEKTKNKSFLIIEKISNEKNTSYYKYQKLLI